MYLIHTPAFISCSSESSRSGWGSSDKAFIFSLRNKEGLGPFKSRLQNGRRDAIRNRQGYHFMESYGVGSDLFLSDSLSYANFGHTFQLPSGVKHRQSILAGSYEFTPDEMEVLYLD